jgi:hypothetical protein
MTEDAAKSEDSTSQVSSTDPSKLVTDSVDAVTPKTDEITAIQDSIGTFSNMMDFHAPKCGRHCSLIVFFAQRLL